MAWRLWLQTQQGRLFLQGSVVVAGIGSFSAYLLPQTYFLNKYQEFVQNYSKGLCTPVASKVLELYEDVLSDMKVSASDKKLLKLFTVYGFDLFHAGSTVLVSGAIIGVPINFKYETEGDVDRKIRVVTKSIDWESEEGANLRSALVLSEDARKFGLAREVSASRSIAVWLYSIYPTIAIVSSYIMSVKLNDRLLIRNHPFRFIMYGLVTLFNAAAYCTMTDLTTSSMEQSSDNEAAMLGASYVRGGIEFYSKLRERNKALRVLMGEAGEKLYTTSGNEVVFLRMKSTPLSDRLLALEQLLPEKSQSNNS